MERKETILMEAMDFFDPPNKGTQELIDPIIYDRGPTEENKVQLLGFLNGGKWEVSEEPPLENENIQLYVQEELKNHMCSSKVTLPQLNQQQCVTKNSYKITAYKTKEKLLTAVSLIVIQENLYGYNGFYYEQSNHADIARLVVAHCREEVETNGTPKLVNDAIELLLMEPKIHIMPQKIPRNLLSFQNGVLNFQTKALLMHSQDYLTLYGIKGNYLANVSVCCPVFDEFLSTITGGDELLMRRIYEFIGYVLSPDTNAKVFFVLQGVPNSGKSVLTTFLSGLFTENAVMTLDAHVFSDKYSISELVGKALCISPDLPAAPLDEKAVSKIKQITGNDVVSSNRKYESYVSFRCNAKIILVTNHPLITKGNDSAFEERIVTIPFQYSIPREAQNNMLIPQLLGERDAIITNAIRAYYQLVINRYRFSGNYPINAVVADDYESATDVSVSIYEFVRRTFTQNVGDIVFMEDAYQKYCSMNPRISLNEFSQYFKRFAEKIYSGKKDRKRKEGEENAKSCICGIKWKEEL